MDIVYLSLTWVTLDGYLQHHDQAAGFDELRMRTCWYFTSHSNTLKTKPRQWRRWATQKCKCKFTWQYVKQSNSVIFLTGTARSKYLPLLVTNYTWHKMMCALSLYKWKSNIFFPRSVKNSKASLKTSLKSLTDILYTGTSLSVI